MSLVYRAPCGRYAVAEDHIPDEVVAIEADPAAARALAERLNAERAEAAPFPPPREALKLG